MLKSPFLYRKNRGAGLVEFVVLWPALILVVLSTVQLGLMYRAKSTFNHATFAAAREGAVSNAMIVDMRRALANSLAPLYLNRAPDLANYGIATAESRLLNSTIPAGIGGVRVDIVSPTQAIFNRFAVDARPLVRCRNSNRCPHGGEFEVASRNQDLRRQIPNDNLSVRSAANQRIGSGSNAQLVNLQDANILKIRTHMCYKLEVPLINRIIYRILLFSGTPVRAAPLAIDRPVHGGQPNFATRDAMRGDHWGACTLRSIGGDFYIPFASSSVVRMQSPVQCEGDLRRGRNCRNLQ